MRTIVCYGDSNTFGTDPAGGARFARDVRWPGVLAAELDGEAFVIEEGLSGRTTIWDDPFLDGRNGKPYLLPCLRSHAPIDVLVLMLGTNDLKSIFGRAASEIAAGAGALVDIALTSGTGPAGGRPGILVVGPPRLGAATAQADVWGFGASRAMSEALPPLYRTMTEMKGVAFLDGAAFVEGDPADGVHLGRADHAVLGRAVAAAVRPMLGLRGRS